MSIAMLFGRPEPVGPPAAIKKVVSPPPVFGSVKSELIDEEEGSLLLPWTVLLALSAWPVFIVSAILWVIL